MIVFSDSKFFPKIFFQIFGLEIFGQKKIQKLCIGKKIRIFWKFYFQFFLISSKICTKEFLTDGFELWKSKEMKSEKKLFRVMNLLIPFLKWKFEKNNFHWIFDIAWIWESYFGALVETLTSKSFLSLKQKSCQSEKNFECLLYLNHKKKIPKPPNLFFSKSKNSEETEKLNLEENEETNKVEN